MPECTHRPRSGDSVTLAAGTQSARAIPGNATSAKVFTETGDARVLVQPTNNVPAVTATSYGYALVNFPLEIDLYRGSDKYIILANDTAGSITVKITYFN